MEVIIVVSGQQQNSSNVVSGGRLFSRIVEFMCKITLNIIKTGNISKRDEMPQNGILEVEPFDC